MGRRSAAVPWQLLRPLGLLAAVSLSLFLALFLVDYFLAAQRPSLGPMKLLFSYDMETAQNALSSLAQVVVAVLGIVITVVSIVVQLAATRYTARVAEMFFRERTNLIVLSFFVVTCVSAVWVPLSVGQGFVPEKTITVTLVLVTLSLLIMVPYFAYVFHFLDPMRIVARIEEQALASAVADHGEVPARQRSVVGGIEQLGDIAINAVSNKDKLIAASAVNALKDLAVGYLPRKAANAPAWFEVRAALRENPDFIAMSQESIVDLTEQRTWTEWKILRQLQAIYSSALAEAPDINYLIAIDTRYVGETALAAGDAPALSLALKFMNTYLRITLNAQNVRTAYNVMNQYRQLAERVLAHGRADTVVEIGGYFRYYAQLALSLNLGFVTETVAYDMATLCEAACAAGSPAHEALLQCLLNVDRAAETEAEETTLRGVRKAQIKLATSYLVHGHDSFAREVFLDMKEEPAERLRSIWAELARIESKDYWEIIDRGTNLDYLDAVHKEQLEVFFSWFEGLKVS